MVCEDIPHKNWRLLHHHIRQIMSIFHRRLPAISIRHVCPLLSLEIFIDLLIISVLPIFLQNHFKTCKIMFLLYVLQNAYQQINDFKRQDIVIFLPLWLFGLPTSLHLLTLELDCTLLYLFEYCLHQRRYLWCPHWHPWQS